MITEIVIFLSAFMIAVAIFMGSRYIAWAIKPPTPKESMAKDLLGRVKKAQIVHKKDYIDFLI